MDDEIPNAMNLDLNLGPVYQSYNETEPELHSFAYEAINLEDSQLDNSRFRQAVRQRRQVWRSVWRQLQVPPEATRNIALELTGASDLHVGEGSVAAEISASAVAKICDKIDGCLGDEVFEKKDKGGTANGTAGSCFDCNICLDLAKDPVVTCCGHLFCWACLYRWLHLHSDAMECPVCKGEVMLKNVTPIFGRGSFDCQPEDDINLKIPPRPQARRFDSSRQAFQRSAFSIPVEEMIRHLDNRFDLSSQVQPPNAVESLPSGSQERSSSLLDRILTSRRMRREHNTAISPSDAVDLIDAGESHQIPSILLRRSNSNRAATISHLTSALSSAERLVESYSRSQPVVRNQVHNLVAVEDRDVISPSDVDSGESHQIPSILVRRSNSNRAATISHLTSALSSAERLVESYSRSHPIVRNQDHHPVAFEDREVISPSDVIDLIDAGDSHQIRRSNSNRAATISHLTSALSSAERLVEFYFRGGQPVVRNRGHHTQAVEDRDSMSSIAAVIESDSQTVDTTTIEIDSTILLSTSSSRRRNDASRTSDNDSGDSRGAHRRRLN